MYRKACAIIALVLGLPAAVWAWPGPDVGAILQGAPDESVSELYRGESVSQRFSAGESLSLLPDTPGIAAHLEVLRDEYSFRLGVEVARYVRIPLSDDPSGTGLAEIDAYNILRSLSRMEGIEYYSQRRERMRVLFTESHAIVAPDDSRRIADPTVTTIPDRDVVYARQVDQSFGDYRYEVEYRRVSEGLLLIITNIDRMSYGLLPVLAPESLMLTLSVIPVADGIVVYGAAFADVRALFGLGNRVADSLENRINALVAWFVSEAGWASQ